MENPMMAGGGGGGGGGGILDFDPHHHHHHHQLHHLVSHLSASAAASPSDDDDPTASAAADDENGHGYGGGGAAAASRDGAKKGGSSSSAPWQRMKWTDDIVRLLIRLVALVGDDPAAATESDGAGAGAGAGCSRRKPHGGGGGAASSSSALQKKGKWKTISRLMLERGGCRVSPQQCEDKFNDLNKRYKRLNEILGRGTSCRVVENPSLLDSLPHVTAKGKDDVRKILSSKHLFYREMCAYHNGQRIPSSVCHAADLLHPPKPSNGDHGQENDHDDDNNGDDDEDDDDDDEENDDGDDVDRKRGFEGFNADVGGIPPSELREWFKKRALQLLEERVGIEAEGFEIEKRRFKWQRFKSKKDRELERLRLENERMMLENERMLMLVRQKEYELNSKPEEASGGGYQMEMGRVQ